MSDLMARAERAFRARKGLDSTVLRAYADGDDVVIEVECAGERDNSDFADPTNEWGHGPGIAAEFAPKAVKVECKGYGCETCQYGSIYEITLVGASEAKV